MTAADPVEVICKRLENSVARAVARARRELDELPEDAKREYAWRRAVEKHVERHALK